MNFDEMSVCCKAWPHEAASKEARCGRSAARTASSCAPGGSLQATAAAGAAATAEATKAAHECAGRLSWRWCTEHAAERVGCSTPVPVPAALPFVCLVTCEARRVAPRKAQLMSPLRGLSPRPYAYGAHALPAELRRHLQWFYRKNVSLAYLSVAAIRGPE